jgi:hypothetical protein
VEQANEREMVKLKRQHNGYTTAKEVCKKRKDT